MDKIYQQSYYRKNTIRFNKPTIIDRQPLKQQQQEICPHMQKIFREMVIEKLIESVDKKIWRKLHNKLKKYYETIREPEPAQNKIPIKRDYYQQYRGLAPKELFRDFSTFYDGKG